MGRILHLHLKSVPSTSRPAPLPLPLAPGRGTVRQAGRRTAPPSLPHPKRSPPPPTPPHSLKDVSAPLDVRQGHRDQAVEPAGPLEGGVERLGQVGGGDDNHPVVGFKSILFEGGCACGCPCMCLREGP